MSIEKTVFVITYGRSGSTLLQGILNSIDGYEIKGENMAGLVPLFRSYKKIFQSRYEHGKFSMSERDPWYGADAIVPDEYARGLISTFIDEVIKPSKLSRVIGFKEIRYGGVEFPDIEQANEYLSFLKKFFPKVHFVFNERNVKDTAGSGWWADDPSAEETIADLLQRMRLMYEAHQENSYWLCYDDYRNKPKALSGLFDFLGEGFDVGMVSEVMSRKHSY